MADPVKRVRYFDHQMIRADDLTLDQTHHRRMRQLHTRLLQGWGVGEGLDVAAAGEDVIVKPGVAFDRDGREMVLTEPVRLKLADLMLEPSAPAWVTATWAEQQTDPSDDGVGEATRWSEVPQVAAAAAPPADPGYNVILGKVLRTDGKVTAVDDSDRRVSSLPDPDQLHTDIARRIARDAPETMQGPLSIGGELRLGTGSRLVGDAGGQLSITAQALTISAPTLSIGGNTTIGMQTARRQLSLFGDIAANQAMLFMGRVDNSPATAGEVLGGIGFKGKGVQHGQLSFRAGSGFELVDRSKDSPSLSYTSGIYPYADLRARSVYASGNVVVGAGGTGKLQVRSIDGKRTDNDNPDSLYLNAANGMSVQIGSLPNPASLTVWGSVSARGDIVAGSGSNGRVLTRHIDGKGTGNDNPDWLNLNWSTGMPVQVGGSKPAHLVVNGSVFVAGRTIAELPAGSSGGVVTKNLYCNGTKQFLIDHPLDPQNRHLAHATLESPEHAVVYRGEARLENSVARVELPNYFEALTRQAGRTVIVTPKAEPGTRFVMLGASAVRDGAFTVHAHDDTAPSQQFYWEVKAIRADVAPLTVEVPKTRATTSKGNEHAATVS